MSFRSKLILVFTIGVLFFVWKGSSLLFGSSGPKRDWRHLEQGTSGICATLPPTTGAGKGPLQSRLPRGMKPFRYLNANMEALAGYSIRARVLSRLDYNDSISPMDVAVGWGPMAQEALVQQFSFSQGGRFAYWYYSDSLPIPRKEVESHFANMHLIPAIPLILYQINGIQEGDILYLDGGLIYLEKEDGWRWKSSLSRTDTGNGACELMLVCRASVISNNTSGR